jgi:hypothetical protein
MVLVGSKMGRVVSRDNINLRTFRWTGSVLAVYECGFLGEGGMKGRKSRGRGPKRRGCRSGLHRRKSRAVVGCDPESVITAPPETSKVGSSSARRYKRRLAYSQALIDAFIKKGKTIDRMKERSTHGFISLEHQDEHWEALRRVQEAQRRCRRHWFDLARHAPGFTPMDGAFLQTRFDVLSLGIDGFAARVFSRQGNTARARRGMESQDEIERGELATTHEEEKDSEGCRSCRGKFGTKVPTPVCTSCGRALSERAKKRLSVAKAPWGSNPGPTQPKPRGNAGARTTSRR